MDNRQLTLEELKKIQLGILSDVDRFCRLHNIRYSLAYGTLLGAVRHKGFIPWDDDIDIWMTREGYEIFRKTYKSDRYYLVDSTFEMELPYGKVCDGNTVLIENAVYSFSPGVFIDVFPIDYLSSDETERKKIKKRIFRLNQIKSIKEIRLSSSRNILKNITLLILKFLVLPISYRSVIKRLSALMISTSKDKAICMTDYNDFEKDDRFPLNSFENIIDMPFEGLNFKAIANYDDILSSAYGDYMMLPPVDRRVTHHDYIARMK